MSSDNSYVIRAPDATDRFIANQNGNTTRSGNLDAQGLTSNKPSNDSETPLKEITTKTVKLWLWRAR